MVGLPWQPRRVLYLKRVVLFQTFREVYVLVIPFQVEGLDLQYNLHCRPGPQARRPRLLFVKMP